MSSKRNIPPSDEEELLESADLGALTILESDNFK